MSRIARRFALIGSAIAVALAAGTAGFMLIEGYPLFDAFYMTLITITTVGYTEVHPLSHAGRIFNAGLIMFGVTTIFFAIGLMTQTIVELELGEVFGKRRTKRMIDKLEKHYIVCGFGRVGRSAAMELQREGMPLVVIDRNPERVERAGRAGILAIAADSTRDDALREAGVGRARGLVAALATDADNLFVILSAKTLNPMLNVAARVSEEESAEKLRRAGADTVFAPYTNAGYRLTQSLLRPHVVQFLDSTSRMMGLDVNIEQVPVSRESELASRSLRDMQFRRELGVIVLAIRKADGQMLFNPPAEAMVEGGDLLIVMGEQEALRKVESLLTGVKA